MDPEHTLGNLHPCGRFPTRVLTLFSPLCFLQILPGHCAGSGSGIGELFRHRGLLGDWFLGKWWRKTAFRRRDLPTYRVSSLLIRGLRLTRENVGGLLRDAALGRGGLGWPLLRAEPFGVWFTCKSLAAVKSDCCTGPDSYDPDIATKFFPPGVWFKMRESSHYHRAAGDPAWASASCVPCLLTSPL